MRSLKWGDRVLPAGSELFGLGEPCFELYTLLDGWVTLYHILGSGRCQILDFALPGAFLGYQPDLYGPMLHGAECLTDVSVCVISRRSFVPLIRKHPNLAIRLASLTSHQALGAQDNLTNVGSRSAQARIVHLLLKLYERINERQPIMSGEVVEMPLAQHHIADAIGFSSVYVSQTLKSLREQGLISYRRGRLQLPDPEGLRKVLDQDEIFAA